LTTELSEQVLRQASDWFARMHGGDATAQDHVRLADWLAANAEHRQAYDFVTETCRLAARAHEQLADRQRVVPFRSRRKVAVGGAMALAATIVGGIAIVRLIAPETVHYQTAIGEIRTITLADGSALTLNGATALDVSFSRHAREIALKTGEFFITVGKDPARPFRVHAGDRTIEDIGTAFDVDTNGQDVDVAVGEGTIMISAAPGTAMVASGGGIVLNKGQALTYTPGANPGAPRAVASQQIGTWRVGILSYDQVPLQWLVADLNRQFDGGIRVPDPGLAAMPVTLTLKLHDRETTVGTLEKLLPVHAVAQGTGAIELVSAKP
jgi:transmembrane sensor